jgi:hypothetical protein
VIPVAEVGFVEATWVLVLKSLVIFAVVFAVVPPLTAVERKRCSTRWAPYWSSSRP